MNIIYYREQRKGPEASIENAVAAKIPQLFTENRAHIWAASSIQVGAGIPDLVAVAYKPEIQALEFGSLIDIYLLAYLRSTKCAHLDTLTERLGYSRQLILEALEKLLNAKAVTSRSEAFRLTQTWRNILPEVYTIEAKVANWRKAIEQANRNRIFSHRSFIALPQKVACRVKNEPLFTKLGIGLISVDDDMNVIILTPPRRQEPKVWIYYYKLAFSIASHCHKVNNNVYNSY